MNRLRRAPDSIGIPVAAAFLTAVLVAGSIYQLRPPAGSPAHAPAERFSAARAMLDVEAISRKPHPTGSAENARVRRYLLQRMKELGLESQVQTTSALWTDGGTGPIVGATVSNVIGRLGGESSTGAVMLAAHYDSVPGGPGAADDGAGVATLLETARALRSGGPLRNDVIFLATDGEELGLLGAKAFVDEHPWAEDVAVAVNFEARGTSGASLMFETGPRNGEMIRCFAEAAPFAVTSSFMYDFYRSMPNDTDFSVFKRSGIQGLNFAFAEDAFRYHTRLDHFRNLDPRSLQHSGTVALALVRRFGNLNFPIAKSEDAIFFSLFGRIFFYPQSWAPVIGAAGVLLSAVVLTLGFRKRRLDGCRILQAFALSAGCGFFFAVAAQFGWRILAASSYVSMLSHGIAYNGTTYAAAFACLAAALVAAVLLLLLPRIGSENMTAGALLWWLAAAAATCFYFRGGSYLFAWPAIAGFATLGYGFLARGRSDGKLVAILAAAAGILLFFPVVYQLVFVMGPSALLLIVLATTLLTAFLVPQLYMAARGWTWGVSLAAGAAAVLFLASAFAARSFGTDRPSADTILYLCDADHGRAEWLSTDKNPDVWTAQFLGKDPDRGGLKEFPQFGFDLPIWKARADAADLRAPRVTIAGNEVSGGARTLRLVVSPPKTARALWLSVLEGTVLRARVEGKSAAREQPGRAPADAWRLYYVAIPDTGLNLELSVPASSAPVLSVTAQYDGLPEFPGRTYRPRPDDIMPAAWPPFDSSSFVTKSFRLAGGGLPAEAKHP